MVSKNILYIPKWFQRGILTIGDIVNEQGHVSDQKEIEKKFNLSQINFLGYHRVKICINIFLGRYRKGDSFNFIQPYIPHHISFLLSNIKGAKGFYEKLNENVIDMAFNFMALLIGKLSGLSMVTLHLTLPRLIGVT